MAVRQKKFVRDEANACLGRQKYTKYNKINNNSENFRGAKLLLGGICLLPSLLSCGPVRN